MENITLSPAQSEQLKKCQLEMLKAFVAVCDRLGLEYYLVGGTLLGAVRHKGFIPWDDDIDVSMPRADYDRFVREGQALLPAYYFIQTTDTDPAFPANFAKIRDSRTTFIETSVSKLRINHGIYMDIFPLDFYPEGKAAVLRFKVREWVLRNRIAAEFYLPAERGTVKGVLRKVLGGVLKILLPDLRKTMDRRERLFRSVPESRLYKNHCGAWGDKEIAPKAWYDNACELEFCGLRAKAPGQYDKILRRVYGDYMQLPPEEQRVGHHYALAIDLDRPYTEYMK